jgi:predicted hotdog family 3-hydroxylacyl-ACP dehydratase
MDNELAQLLPHRPPMVMIDRLISCGDDTATAAKTFEPGGYGTEGDRVPAPALIECLAQTMAAMQGRRARESGRAAQFGMLVGVSGFVFHRPARCGRELTLRVKLETSLAPFLLASGEVREEDRLVAEGALKFYVGDAPPQGMGRV